jgi:hypothetical protein
MEWKSGFSNSANFFYRYICSSKLRHLYGPAQPSAGGGFSDLHYFTALASHLSNTIQSRDSNTVPNKKFHICTTCTSISRISKVSMSEFKTENWAGLKAKRRQSVAYTDSSPLPPPPLPLRPAGIRRRIHSCREATFSAE